MGEIVRSWHSLATLLRARQQAAKCVVSTNGVFDVLHIGHTRYLQAARALGDGLVIGVNSDACTRRLKGWPRPFVPEAERMEMLAALRCVDYVTLFDEPTPIDFLDAIQPDIHVKGGDYNVESLPETSVIRKHGGRVVTVPFVQDHSTSSLVARILAAAEHGPL